MSQTTMQPTPATDVLPRTNPFVTRRTRPGALPFLFPPGHSGPTCLATLRRHDWWGQIVGPHGSGKSTLLATLTPLLAAAGRRVEFGLLHSDDRRLPFDVAAMAAWNGGTQVVVDGFEQLAWWRRAWLIGQCRRRGCGLLVTTHRPMRLPLLWRTRVDDALAHRVVGELLAGQTAAIDRRDVGEMLRRCEGDMRETLFGLYDLVERRRS